jgi:hypothetical protein
MKTQITAENYENLVEILECRRDLDKLIGEMYEKFCEQFGIKAGDFMNEPDEEYVWDLFFDNLSHKNQSPKTSINKFLKAHKITKNGKS